VVGAIVGLIRGGRVGLKDGPEGLKVGSNEGIAVGSLDGFTVR